MGATEILGAGGAVAVVGVVFWGLWGLIDRLDALQNVAHKGLEHVQNNSDTGSQRVVDLEAEVKGLRGRMSDLEELVDNRYRKLIARDRRAEQKTEEVEEEEEAQEQAERALEALYEAAEGRPRPPPRRRSPRRRQRPW